MSNITTHHEHPYGQLLEEYIKICNEALRANKNHFPFGQMWQAISKECSNKKVNISLIDDKPEPICSLSIAQNEVIISDTHQQEVKDECHLKLSHIKQVLKDKQAFIKDPTKIDWHWIEAMIENYKSPQG